MPWGPAHTRVRLPHPVLPAPPPGGQRGQAAFVREGKRWRMLSGKGGQRQQQQSPARRPPVPLTPPSPRSAPGAGAGLGRRGGSAPPPGAYRLLGAVAARLPRVRVVAELDLVGGHPVVPARGRGSGGPGPQPRGQPCPTPYVQMELSPCVMTPVKLVSRRASISSHCSLSSCPAHQPPSKKSPS